MPRLRHGAAGDIGTRLEMQDCHIGYDSFVAPMLPPGSAAAEATVASHAFYGVRSCDCPSCRRQQPASALPWRAPLSATKRLLPELA